jgi:hypothetical protein
VSDDGRRRFADDVAAELRRQGVADALAYDDAAFSLAGGGRSWFLANLFSEWSAASRLTRRRTLERSVEALLDSRDPPDDVGEARSNLMPRVRDREYAEVMALRLGAESPLTLAPLNDHLVAEIVYDFPRSISSLRPERVAGWGMELDEALRTARANLRERTTGTFVPHGPGVFVSPWQDTYDASRLLLTELVTRVDVRGDPVALLPHRDQLILTGTDDEDGLLRAAELAEGSLQDARRVTGRAFVLADGQWQPYLPPVGHPAEEAFRRLVLLTETFDYEEQRVVLQERVGADVYVCETSLLRQQSTGEVLSYCTWTESVPTLLPRATLVSFVALPEGAEPQHVAHAPWDAVVATVGSLMAPQGLRPERWRVDAFPDAAQLDALRASAG